MLTVLAMGTLVLGLELLNSAIEATLDLLHPEKHPLVKYAKDAAAGAVLIGVLAAAAAYLIVFTPPFLQWITPD